MTKSDYLFRARFTMSPRSRLEIEEARWEIDSPVSGSQILMASLEEKPIKDSRELAMRAEGWPSEESARAAGQLHLDALMLTFTRFRIGADFGYRKGFSAFTPFGLDMLAQQIGTRVVNDSHGLLVLEATPPVSFASTGAPTIISLIQSNRFEKAFRFAVQSRPELSDAERLSLDLFHSSFFHTSNDSRFLVLVMAVEALLNPRLRAAEVAIYIDRWKQEVKTSQDISRDDRESLLGSLKWLSYESINRSGRSLAAERLGDREYETRSPASFFSYCYDLRSRLAHGANPPPALQEVGRAAATLEVFVSDLLSGPLREVEF
jgi:hypothetical protein